jgi:hypothetical protein
VFELVKNSNGSYTEKVLHSFSGADGYGSQPQAGVIMDASRNLYGTASRGGASNVGTVFEVVSAEIATTTKLTSSSNPATAGDTVAFTATVSSASGTPAGSVTFSIGSSTLGTVALQSGQAAFTVEDAESLGIGTCTITAEYTPAAGSAFLAGSGALAQTVLEFGVALLTGNNAFSGNQNVTGSVTANSFAGNGSNLTNVNAAEPGGVAAAKYARLDIPNLFNGNQSVTGNLGATGVLKTTGTLVVGNLGTPITEHLSVLVNPGFAALQPLSCASAAFTLTGAANGGTIALGVPTARMTGGGTLLYTAWVSAPNQVTLRACNIDSKAAQKIAGSGAIRVDIWRH